MNNSILKRLFFLCSLFFINSYTTPANKTVFYECYSPPLESVEEQILFYKNYFIHSPNTIFISSTTEEFFTSEMNSLEEEVKKISFGDKLEGFGSEMDAHISWSVTYVDENTTIATGNGSALSEIIYKKPGRYVIHINEKIPSHSEGCNHKMFPEKVEIQVSPVNMKFDFEKIKFSQPIRKNQASNHILLQIPVVVKVYGGDTMEYEIPSVNTSGTGTSIVAKSQISKIILQDGIYDFTYQLSGVVDQESYIMFDFKDFNGNIIGYSHKEKIR